MNPLSWAQQAAPGDVLTYHSGHLVYDREHNKALDQDAEVLMELAEQGFVELRQVRYPALCVYQARRTEELMG